MDRVERRHKRNSLGRNAVRQQAVDCTERKNVTGRWRAASNRWRDMVKVTMYNPLGEKIRSARIGATRRPELTEREMPQ